MDKIISVRKNNQIFSLFIKIQEYQPSLNRTEIIELAIEKALGDFKVENWKSLGKVNIGKYSVSNDKFPEFIQLRVDEEDYQKIREEIKRDYCLDKMSPAPFVIKLLLINYLLYLEKIGMTESVSYREDDIESKEELKRKFKMLSYDDKINTIYDLLLDIKYSR